MSWNCFLVVDNKLQKAVQSIKSKAGGTGSQVTNASWVKKAPKKGEGVVGGGFDLLMQDVFCPRAEDKHSNTKRGRRRREGFLSFRRNVG